MDRFLLGLFAVLLIVTAVLAAAFVLYYQPQTRELEDARQDASRLAQERAALNGRVSDLEHLLDEIRAESEELEAKVQAKEAILAELQSTQDELEQEIATVRFESKGCGVSCASTWWTRSSSTRAK